MIAPIAVIHTDFPEKFGVPRQSGLVPELTGRIVFEPEYRDPDALRGIEGFSHLWLIWDFSEAHREQWKPTVRPPRLGGNTRVGVFATRSPFRPNPIGLSSVRLVRVDLETPEGPVMTVSGIDMMDGTPIYDIKPYLPYADIHTDASAGFSDDAASRLAVVCPPDLLERVPAEKRSALLSVLAADIRPSYQEDPERVYGLSFAGREIRFRVTDGILTVTEIRG